MIYAPLSSRADTAGEGVIATVIDFVPYRHDEASDILVDPVHGTVTMSGTMKVWIEWKEGAQRGG